MALLFSIWYITERTVFAGMALCWSNSLSNSLLPYYSLDTLPCSVGPRSPAALGKWTAAEELGSTYGPNRDVSCVWPGLWTTLVAAFAAGCSQTSEQWNHFRNRNDFQVSAWIEQSAESGGKSRGGRCNGQCCSATRCWSPSLAGDHGHQPSQRVLRPWVKPGTECLWSSNLRLLHVTIKMFFNPLSLLILIHIILLCTGQCWWLNLVLEHGDYWLQRCNYYLAIFCHL